MLVTVAAVQWWHSACVCTVVAEFVAVLVQCTVAAVLHVVVAVLVEFEQCTVCRVAECPSEDSLEVLDQTLLPLLLRYFYKI